MTDNNKKTVAVICNIGLSLITTIVLAFVSHYGITGIELLLPCVFALCVIMFKKAYSVKNKKDYKYTVSLGILTSVLAVTGSHIDMEERIFMDMGLVDVVYMIVLIPFFTAVFILLFFSSDVCRGTEVNANVKANLKKRYLISVGVMLAAWLPYYLTYYPGGIGNDIFECIEMCNGTIPLTNHHPVLFTAILKVYMTLFGFTGNPTLALGMMSLSQMILLAVTLGTVLMWLYKRNVGEVFWYVALIFFAVHPIVAMYSIYVTKDVLFACVVVLLTLYLYEWMNKDVHSKKEWTVLGALSLLTILTRNNGILMIAFLALFMLIFVRREWKGLLVTFAVVFIVNAVYKGPVWNAFGIEKQSFAESASIPLTQVAYTICQDGVMSKENREYLESLMPLEDVKKEYSPGYTDSYKFAKTFNKELLDEDPGKFLKVWFEMLPDNFGNYVEVYLLQTSGYWCYGISNTVATKGVQENMVGVKGVNFLGNIFDTIFEKLVLVARKLPVLCLLSQMGIEILAVVLVGIKYIRANRAKMIVTVIPLIALWISVMIATPAHCLFRYMCPVFFLWPLLIEEFIFANSNNK